jgi:pimeloyl-ACP methyl ester carboxylesterase
VITYDYAGHGHSGGEVANSIKGMAANLISFLHELLPKLNISHIDVLGFSIGGYVAQQLTLDAPNLVNNLILAGTGPSLGRDLERPQAEVQSACFTDPPNPHAVTLAFFPSIVYNEGEAWINRIFTGRAGVAGKNGEPEFISFMGLPKIANLIQAYLGWDADPVPYAMLQTIQKNVLVTAGQNDLIVPTKNSWVLAHQLPRAHYIQYACSGHGHLFQYAKLYVQHVNEFLDGKWPQPVSAGPSPVNQAE